MILNMLNWCWIFVSTFALGTVFSNLLEKIFECRLDKLEARLIIGTIMVNVYAEVFSLFYKVGALATLVLFAVTIVCLAVSFRRSVDEIRTKVLAVKNGSKGRWMTAAIIGIFFLAVSAAVPYLGDTYLYHIDAVEWIEKYGIVKGLGNLHFRFAYNSAYECLGALYSWSSLVGRSLHAVNGYYAAAIVIYCTNTFQWRLHKRLLVSDLLKLITVIYMFGRLLSYGSADTDPLVMTCIAYIFIKWMEFIERAEQSVALYGLLCILGVYACTIKLSAGLIVLLLLYPLVQYIKKREYKKIAFFAVLAIVIAVPYFIRNVLISGYLLYPYTGLDLFDVDWKMPASIAGIDREGIISWGRGIENETDPMNMGISQWLPIWFRNLNISNQVLFCIDVIAVVTFCIRTVQKKMRKVKFDLSDFISMIAVACFVFWMASAPLLRYGGLYMWILPAVVFAYCIEIERICGYICVFMLAVGAYGISAMSLDGVGLVIPADYASFSVTGHETDMTYEDGSAVTIYTPDEGAQADYDYFPETPEQGQLDALEFRGDSLEDGFRSKLAQ